MGVAATDAAQTGSALTETDRFIQEQAREHMAADEPISYWAYLVTYKKGLKAALSKGYFAVVTDRQLVLIQTRVGAFKPLLENKGVEVFPHDDIESIGHEGKAFTIAIAGRDPMKFMVAPKNKHVSGQASFFANLPGVFGGAGPATGAAKWFPRIGWAAVVIAVGIYQVATCKGSVEAPGTRLVFGQNQ